MGIPVIGDKVWIGVNATIVGAIKVGNDVLIAPNTYVNCDVPDHSIVLEIPALLSIEIMQRKGISIGLSDLNREDRTL